MNPPSACFLVHGTNHPPLPGRTLRAGPLSLDYDHADIRAVRLGDHEIIRRLYGAVRDRNWLTVPFELFNLETRIDEHAFHLSFRCEHRFREIHFVWRGEISGTAQAVVRFTFDGEARSTFLRNRIGLCALHPIRECAGAKCRVLYRDHSSTTLTFPTNVAPEQPVEGFHNLAGLSHEVVPGVWAELQFEGDVFETEDQRNWIDASFKTYSTPLSMPTPVEIKAGTRIYQSIELRVHGAVGQTSSANNCATSNKRLAVDIQSSGPKVSIPKIGFAVSDEMFLHGEVEQKRLSALNPAHLRLDLEFAHPAWRGRLAAATRLANQSGVPLELALYLPREGRDSELHRLRNEIAQVHSGISRLVVFESGCTATTAAALELVRNAFGGSDIPIGGGSDADLYELQLRPPPADLDFILWGMNPQVHASDNRSIMETPEGAAQQAASMLQRFPGKPLVISPVTLKPHSNSVATGPESSQRDDELPSAVDPRQSTLFCAAWTVGMLAALAPSGLASITFFQTIGWQGIMESTQGSGGRGRSHSFPAGVFPVWHVFAALAGFCFVANIPEIDRTRIAAFVLLDQKKRRRLVLANTTPFCVRLQLAPASGIARQLDETSVLEAMPEPERWWQKSGKPLRAETTLPAYAILFVDLS